MLSTAKTLNYRYKNQDLSREFEGIASILRFYKNPANAQTHFREMKHDILIICEILRSLRIYKSQDFKEQIYYKLIKKEENDPIDVIRHALVHSDPYLNERLKPEFYKQILDSLSSLENFSTDTRDEFDPIDFSELKENEIYQNFSKKREKHIGSTHVKYYRDMDLDTLGKLRDLLVFIKENMPRQNAPFTQADFVSFRKNNSSVFVAIAEVGEILAQISNTSSEPSKLMLYVHVEDKKVWLLPDVIKAFMDARKGLHHLNSYKQFYAETFKAIDFVQSSFPSVKKKANSLS